MLEPSIPSSTTSVAALPEAPVTSNGDLHAVPDSEATTGPLAAAHAQGSDRMDEDEGMTDDMRIAISALGLMREGSLSGKSPTPTTSSAHAPLHHQQQPLHAGAARTDPFFAEPVHFLAGGAQGRGRSDSRRSDPSRSASTASMASYSEAAWTGAGTSETGFSSPAGSMYIANGAIGSSRDAEMGHNGPAGVSQGGPGESHPAADDPHFMARVSQLPIVSGGIEWYERSKANSRVVKVGGNALRRVIAEPDDYMS